mmetsp:Transcript_10148/g.15378  ORF Transcript_10148/g.15378 Transcript_10148/m.15378 type:complete len:225 (+) Transcript_10148:94-768(+)|eukprot:CAMPEP_0202704336 /NCGR_PEP_ID=MMETSP1385-20130828/17026_1 /ASSEMBLY_ACC=CAM_ASM_000861 /TAXON_ID=933848 /ORGANISM="Elphidium margaritaceum" /LENGTH=224 /DNA_ID=CAMNT_0049362329 /DNA_START=90 /DNA_END=764 /DNA_ORIENTATION=-
MSNPTWTLNIQRSCAVLYFHFFWGICLIILGWTAFAARWIPRIKPYHRILGQTWVYGMIIQIYTSTYVSYNGFRWFIFMFGLICYGSLIIAHTAIRKFQQRLRNTNQSPSMPLKYMGVRTEEANKDNHYDALSTPPGTNNNNNGDSALEALEEQKQEHSMIATDSWFTQARLKQLHGIFMVVSLIMLTGAGAAFVTRFSQTAECKNIYCETDGNGELPTCLIPE